MRALLFFLLWLTPALASAEADPGLRQSIEARIQKSGSPALAVALVRPDGGIEEWAFGKRDVETSQPVTSGMLFRNGSASKMWVAAALLETMRQKGLSPQQQIGSLVDGLHPSVAKLTVHQLLSHSSGLEDSADDFGPHDETALAARMRGGERLRLFSEPGRVFSYSNPGYDLAGYILERLSGKPFADAMDALLKPLGAERTFYRPTMAVTYPFALGHNRSEAGELKIVRPMPDNSAEWPSGLAWTTASDSARFAQMLMLGGKLPSGAQLMDPSTLTAMTQSHVGIASAIDGSSYGYALIMRSAGGRRVWEHGGSISGFSALVTMLPDSKAAVVLLANGNDAELLKEVRDLVLQHHGFGALDTAKEDETGQLRPVSKRVAASILGSWGQSEAQFRIEQRPEGLTLFTGKRNSGVLRSAGKDRLGLVSPKGKVESYLGIVRDNDGTPAFLARGFRSFVRIPAKAKLQP